MIWSSIYHPCIKQFPKFVFLTENRAQPSLVSLIALDEIDYYYFTALNLQQLLIECNLSWRTCAEFQQLERRIEVSHRQLPAWLRTLARQMQR